MYFLYMQHKKGWEKCFLKTQQTTIVCYSGEIWLQGRRLAPSNLSLPNPYLPVNQSLLVDGLTYEFYFPWY